MSTNKLYDFLAASAETRFRLVLNPEYTKDLKDYLGEQTFQEYVTTAERVIRFRDRRHLSNHAPTNLIFVPGVMGSLLYNHTAGGIWWINPWKPNRLDELKLSPDGKKDARPDYQIAAFAAHTIYKSLSAAILERDDFGHEAFPYDWRKPIALSTRALRDKILATYSTNGNIPIHLVAHSMGGLVIRATLMEYSTDLQGKIGRIVFIGTPHYGSPAIATYLKNHLWGFDLMALLGVFISRETFRSLWGVLSLLPAPQGIYPGTRDKLSSPNIENQDTHGTYFHPCANFDMYQAESWKLNLSSVETLQLQQILDGVADFHRSMYHAHQKLDQVDWRNRMAVIAGVGYQMPFHLAYRSSTFDLWEHMRKVKKRIPTDPHYEGDGSVPLASASLENVGAIRYVKGTHRELPMIPEVYADTFRWLKGQPMRLPKTLKGALSAHLGGGAGFHETPRLDSAVRTNVIDDDPGYWNIEEPNPIDIAALQAKLRVGQLPEFINLSLL